MLVYPVGTTKACQYAAAFLQQKGVSLTDHPSPEVTHLLLDVPSFAADGTLRGGGILSTVLSMLPDTLTVVGGNLNHPALNTYRTIDLLQDPEYLAMNAAITADCTLRVAAPLLETTFSDTPVLIIGWGRIGKCLGQLLKALGSEVTVAARKETDRAMLRALGYRVLAPREICGMMSRFRLVINTAPELILHKEQLSSYKECVKIDLASKPGLEGEDVIWARGLPGIHAPESSGRLIAGSFLRRCREVSE